MAEFECGHGHDGDALVLAISNVNTAEVWFETKHRAEALRRYRDKLHPGLATELRELEEAGY